jgi:hypothetical protein
MGVTQGPPSCGEAYAGAPRQGAHPSLHFNITSNFLRFELAAIYHDVGKPDMSPIDLFGAL